MRLTIFYSTSAEPDGTSTVLDVASDMPLEDFKALVEADTGIPSAQQYLMCKNQALSSLSPPTLAGEYRSGSAILKLEEDDIIYVSTQARVPRRSGGNQAQTQQQQGGSRAGSSAQNPFGNDASLAATAERLRTAALADAGMRDRLAANYPELSGDALNSSEKFAEAYSALARRQEATAREKEEVMARLNDDPFDVESQAKIEEIIRMENVKENMSIALENIPESFTKTTMLYVPVIVNGVPVKAFVDSGAQATIISGSCAERTGLMRLLDRNYAGMARGVGTAPILGRIHVAILSIGGVALHCSFTVMDGKDVDLLLGLDMLKRHRASINLKRNVLEISDIEVGFLPEKEIPGAFEEPVIQGPGGTQIGGRSGAVLGPGEGSGHGTLSLSGGGGSKVSGGASAGASAAGQAAKQHWGQQGSGAAAATPTPTPTAPRPSGGARGGGEFPRSAIEAVMAFGVSEREAIEALRLTGGNADAAASMFFGD